MGPCSGEGWPGWSAAEMLHWQLSPGRTEKCQWMPLFSSTFCQDCFLKAITGQSIWRLICIGIRWKEKYFQLRPGPNLSSFTTALKDSCQPEYQVKYAPKTRTAPCWRSEQQHNQEFVRWCMVLQDIHKEEKKSDLLNKLQFQNIFSALKFTLSETVPTDKQFTQVAQMCWTHHGLTEYFSVFMSVQYKSA